MLTLGERDEDAWRDVLAEIIREKGEVVYKHEWDSGGPGAGAGSEVVYEFRKVYWPCSSVEGIYGPFDTLTQAILSGGFHKVTAASTVISCSQIASAKLSRMLILLDTPRVGGIGINGKRWEVGARGQLKPCKR